MTLIGLTGGIASGKSTIAARFAELGAHIVDADQLARDVVAAGSPTLGTIAEAFGEAVLLADGSLDRARLGQLVFPDPRQLDRLNKIIHPAIGRLAQETFRTIAKADPQGIVVYDIPLLVEHPNPYAWDLVVVADAPETLRLQRLMQLRGLTEEEARSRIARQASDAERRAAADVLIDTSGTIEHTLAQVDALWAQLPAHLAAARDASQGAGAAST